MPVKGQRQRNFSAPVLYYPYSNIFTFALLKHQKVKIFDFNLYFWSLFGITSKDLMDRGTIYLTQLVRNDKKTTGDAMTCIARGDAWRLLPDVPSI